MTSYAVRITEKSPYINDLRIETIAVDPPQITKNQVLIEVIAAGVDPSDVKAALDQMPSGHVFRGGISVVSSAKARLN